MTKASTTSSCRDNLVQRSLPDEIICVRANVRTSLARLQIALTSDVSRRPLPPTYSGPSPALS